MPELLHLIYTHQNSLEELRLCLNVEVTHLIYIFFVQSRYNGLAPDTFAM